MNMQPLAFEETYHSPVVARLRADLALALRAAAHHGIAEGVCNHFSIAIPEDESLFLLTSSVHACRRSLRSPPGVAGFRSMMRSLGT